MGVRSRRSPSWGEFSAFVADVEPRLLQALVARYGPVDGREATIDALSWAWENWQRLADVRNKAGYLYRVGQSATRRFSPRPLPSKLSSSESNAGGDDLDEVVDRDLVDALRGSPNSNEPWWSWCMRSTGPRPTLPSSPRSPRRRSANTCRAPSTACAKTWRCTVPVDVQSKLADLGSVWTETTPPVPATEVGDGST